LIILISIKYKYRHELFDIPPDNHFSIAEMAKRRKRKAATTANSSMNVHNNNLSASYKSTNQKRKFSVDDKSTSGVCING